jgi:cold shock CspA family protein
MTSEMESEEVTNPKIKRGRTWGIISRVTDREFGFIAPDSRSRDVFFHAKELSGILFKELVEGEQVTFETVIGRNGSVAAANIRRHQDELDHADTYQNTDKSNAQHLSPVLRAIKQCSLALVREIAMRPASILDLEWRDLERVAAEVLERLGFEVELGPGSKDGGKDLVVYLNDGGEGRRYLIEIKHWRPPSMVGKKTLENFIHVVASEAADGGVFLSTSGFRKNVFECMNSATSVEVRLGGTVKITRMCQEYVKSELGIWTAPKELNDLLFEDTLDFR